MSNTLLTPTAVTREALRVLHQKLNFIGTINRQYDDSFAKSGAKIGDSLKIRLPNQYTVRTGRAINVQDTEEESVTLQVATQKGVDTSFTSAELTLSLDDFSERILKPAMSVLAAALEADAMNMYKDVYQAVWVSSASALYGNVLAGRVQMQNSLAPLNDRYANMNPQAMADLVDNTKTLFNDQAQLGKQYKEGYMGRAAGFDFMENTLWPGHTRGAQNTAYVMNTSTGITSGSSSLSVITVGAGAGVQGDIMTIEGVYSVHHESKVSTGILQKFVVLAAFASGATTWTVSPTPVTSGAKQNVTIVSAGILQKFVVLAAFASGATTWTVSPTPVTSGAKQNVTIVSAGASKAITWLGTASDPVDTSMLYQKDAFTFATADLVMPDGVDFAKREVLDGISMRIVRQYSISDDSFPCRIDVLYGYKTLRAMLATRLHFN